MADDRRHACQSPSRCYGCPRRNAGRGSNKRGLNSKVHLAVDAHGNPLRVLVTKGTRADCKEAENLIEGLPASNLLADRGYDTNSIIGLCEKNDTCPVIPPKKNRTVQRNYDKDLYRERHLVENAFEKLKRWRGVATRYAKNTASFLAAVHIRCLALWLHIS